MVHDRRPHPQAFPVVPNAPIAYPFNHENALCTPNHPRTRPSIYNDREVPMIPQALNSPGYALGCAPSRSSPGLSSRPGRISTSLTTGGETMCVSSAALFLYLGRVSCDSPTGTPYYDPHSRILRDSMPRLSGGRKGGAGSSRLCIRSIFHRSVLRRIIISIDTYICMCNRGSIPFYGNHLVLFSNHKLVIDQCVGLIVFGCLGDSVEGIDQLSRQY